MKTPSIDFFEGLRRGLATNIASISAVVKVVCLFYLYCKSCSFQRTSDSFKALFFKI